MFAGLRNRVFAAAAAAMTILTPIAADAQTQGKRNGATQTVQVPPPPASQPQGWKSVNLPSYGFLAVNLDETKIASSTIAGDAVRMRMAGLFTPAARASKDGAVSTPKEVPFVIEYALVNGQNPRASRLLIDGKDVVTTDIAGGTMSLLNETGVAADMASQLVSELNIIALQQKTKAEGNRSLVPNTEIVTFGRFDGKGDAQGFTRKDFTRIYGGMNVPNANEEIAQTEVPANGSISAFRLRVTGRDGKYSVSASFLADPNMRVMEKPVSLASDGKTAIVERDPLFNTSPYKERIADLVRDLKKDNSLAAYAEAWDAKMNPKPAEPAGKKKLPAAAPKAAKQG